MQVSKKARHFLNVSAILAGTETLKKLNTAWDKTVIIMVDKDLIERMTLSEVS